VQIMDLIILVRSRGSKRWNGSDEDLLSLEDGAGAGGNVRFGMTWGSAGSGGRQGVVFTCQKHVPFYTW
jgi:hypothetical protein